MLDFVLFKKSMDRLGSFYSKALQPIQLDEWYGFFANEHSKVFSESVENYMQSERYFPTPKDLRAYADQVKLQNRERENGEERSGLSKLKKQNASDSKFVKAMKNILNEQMAMMGKGTPISSEILAEKLFELDKKFPKKGVANEAKRVLHRWYQRNGLKTPSDQMPEDLMQEKTFSSDKLCNVGACSRVAVWSTSIGGAGPWYCRGHA